MTEVPEVLVGVLDSDQSERPPKPDDVIDAECPICGKPFASKPYSWHSGSRSWQRNYPVKTCSQECRYKLIAVSRKTTTASGKTTTASRKTPSTPSKYTDTSMVFTVNVARRTTCDMTPAEVAADMRDCLRGALAALKKIDAQATNIELVAWAGRTTIEEKSS